MFLASLQHRIRHCSNFVQTVTFTDTYRSYRCRGRERGSRHGGGGRRGDDIGDGRGDGGAAARAGDDPVNINRHGVARGRKASSQVEAGVTGGEGIATDGGAGGGAADTHAPRNSFKSCDSKVLGAFRC